MSESDCKTLYNWLCNSSKLTLTSVKLLHVFAGNAVSYLIKKTTVIVTGRPKAVLSLRFHLFMFGAVQVLEVLI